MTAPRETVSMPELIWDGWRVAYLLGCRECGDGEDLLLVPFPSAKMRGQWASLHTRATGHDRWIAGEERRER